MGLNNWKNRVDAEEHFGRTDLRVVRSKEIRVCSGHVKYEMLIRHPSGELKKEVNMHVDPRVGRNQNFQLRFLSFHIREFGLGRFISHELPCGSLILGKFPNQEFSLLVTSRNREHTNF